MPKKDVFYHTSPTCWRYGSEEMRNIFYEGEKLGTNLMIESTLSSVQAGMVLIPLEAAEDIKEHATTEYVTPEEVWKREQEIKHDVKAMIDALVDACKGEGKKFAHYGATSFDIEDNRNSLQIAAASGILLSDIRNYGLALAKRAEQYKDLPATGRTHGQWAEPITFGFKLAHHLADAIMDYSLISEFLEKHLVGKPMTGAVGTSSSYVHLFRGEKEKARKMGKKVMEKLGLRPATLTTQVISRKMHTYGLHTVAQSSSSCYKFAQEVWDLQRPEIREARETPYKPKTVASSAMPHKAAFGNPINTENIMSLSRVVRALANAEFENIPLHHERDLTNSGAERIIFPLSYILADECLRRSEKIASGMEVNEKFVKRNFVNASAFTAAEPLMLSLTKKGMGREEAHDLMQKATYSLYSEPEISPDKAAEVYLSFPEISSRLSHDEITAEIDKQQEYTGNAKDVTEEVISLAREAFK